MPLSMIVISEGLCTCISVGLFLLLLRVNFEVEEAKAVIGLLRVVRASTASQVGKVLTGREIPAWRTMPHSKARERAASF